jgi:hypothetical protein
LCETSIDAWLSKNHFGPQQVYALILCNVIYHYMPFQTLCFIEFQGPCSIDLNLGQSDKCISESTVHRLSDDALFVHLETSLDIKSSNFKALVAEI